MTPSMSLNWSKLDVCLVMEPSATVVGPYLFAGHPIQDRGQYLSTASVFVGAVNTCKIALFLLLAPRGHVPCALRACSVGVCVLLVLLLCVLLRASL